MKVRSLYFAHCCSKVSQIAILSKYLLPVCIPSIHLTSLTSSSIIFQFSAIFQLYQTLYFLLEHPSMRAFPPPVSSALMSHSFMSFSSLLQCHLLEKSSLITLCKSFTTYKMPLLPLCYFPLKHASPPSAPYLLICVLSVSPYWTATSQKPGLYLLLLFPSSSDVTFYIVLAQ